jgi:hypothetical protein
MYMGVNKECVPTISRRLQRWPRCHHVKVADVMPERSRAEPNQAGSHRTMLFACQETVRLSLLLLQLPASQSTMRAAGPPCTAAASPSCQRNNKKRSARRKQRCAVDCPSLSRSDYPGALRHEHFATVLASAGTSVADSSETIKKWRHGGKQSVAQPRETTGRECCRCCCALAP